jgi:hypothetical protein
MADNPGTTTTADAPPAGGELDTRVSDIEREQKEQRGILEQVLSIVKGGGGGGGQAPAAGPSSPAGPVDIGAIQQQVRDEIAAAEERRKRDAAERGWREEVTAVVERVKRERTPREPETGPRAALQRLLIGRQS